MRSARRTIGVRDGRSSRTVTGSSATTSPARSARRISSVSKRSAPVRHCRASGSTALRRISFIPWVSDTDRPNPTRRIVAKPAVTARRGHGRVSLVPGARFDPTTIAGAADPDRAVVEASPRPVEELEVVVVDVEEHDGVAVGGEDAVADRFAVVGDGPGVHDHLGLPRREVAGERAGGVGGAVLDHEHLEREAPRA